MKKILFLLFFLTANLMHGQNVNTWFRTTLSKELYSQLSVDLELQHRRQQSFDHQNPFTKNLVYAVRPWINYTFKNESKLHFSPLAYYQLYPTIQKEEDLEKSVQKELRSSLASTFLFPIAPNLSFYARTMLEYRLFLHNNNWFRHRNRVEVKYRFHSKYAVLLQEEILLNLNQLANKNRYDQNRITLGVSKASTVFNYELGYSYVHRMPQKSNFYISDHNFYVNFRMKL